MYERQRYDQGVKLRRPVLGDPRVDSRLKNRYDFNGGFQDLITSYAWGEVWSALYRSRRSRLSSLLS